MGKADGTASLKKEEKKARKRAEKDKKKAEKKEQKRQLKERKRQEKLAAKKVKHGVGAGSAAKNDENVLNIPEKITTVDDPQDSVFFKKHVEVSLSVLPAAMSNIQASLEDSLRMMLLRYVDKVGIILTFENMKILSNNGYGMILDEFPNLHYKVGFDGLVFCPEIGKKLTGKVTESFPSHLGMLVLDYVNAMIPSHKLREAGYIFDFDTQQWKRDDSSESFSNDDRVEFVIDRIHECAGTLSMEGSINSSFVL